MFKEVASVLLKSEVFWSAVFVVVMAIAAFIVKRTKTQKDDQIFAMIVNAFNLAEKAIPDSTGPAWLGKVNKALATFRTSYYDRYGTNPPDDLMQFAQDQWAIFALELKKFQRSGD